MGRRTAPLFKPVPARAEPKDERWPMLVLAIVAAVSALAVIASVVFQ